MTATAPPSAPRPDASAPGARVPHGASAEWAGRGEQGHRMALRLMAWIAVTLGRSAARLLLGPIALYYLVAAPRARRHSARYLGRVLGRPARWRDLLRHFHSFSATVLDRVYFVSGRMQSFEFQVDGAAIVDEALAEGRGAFLLGAHVGSFEALHAIAENRPGLSVAMAMYPDNAQKIHAVLQALAPGFRLGIIPIGRSGSTLAMRDWLDAGGLVGLLGDRHLGTPGARAATHELPFLGRPARFTDGPLRLALLLRRRVVFMAGLYRGGRRYDVRFESLADFSRPELRGLDTAARDELVLQALQAYVVRLETLVRQAPYNWFNFFDFWNEDPPCPGSPAAPPPRGRGDGPGTVPAQGASATNADSALAVGDAGTPPERQHRRRPEGVRPGSPQAVRIGGTVGWRALLSAGLLAGLLAAAAPAWAAFDLATLTGLLAQRKSAQASFTEERFVGGIDGPLRARGTLSYNAPDRFSRQTLEPLDETLSVEGNTVTFKRGNRSRQMALDAVPELTALIEAVRGTLSGDAATLQKHFNTRVEGSSALWVLTLTPLPGQLAQVRELKIAGQGSDLRSVELWLAGGDRSLMIITPLAEAAPASPAR